MITRFLLARHATCALSADVLLGRSVDSALDERGESQAVALAQRVARDRPDLVLTSPLRRARQTAHALVAHAGCPLQIAAALDEVDFGEWGGQPFAELEHNAHWQRWNRERSACRTPAGDSMIAVQARIVDYLHELALAFPGSTLALVSHAEVIRSALLRVLNMPIDTWQRIDIAPASLTTLRMTAAGLRVESVNEPVTAARAEWRDAEPARPGAERPAA